MGVEEEIRKQLLQGYTPRQLIQKGYQKSTVYKVYNSIKQHIYTADINKPGWQITNIRFNREGARYLPGDIVSLSFNFHNLSNNDIYLHRIGLNAEWLPPDKWQVIDVRDLVKSGQERPFSLTIQVPKDITLGEYELRLGVEKQYLPTIGYQSEHLTVEWSEPVIIHIKKPLNGNKVFISHSVHDIAMIRQLAQQLDIYGFEPIIAEDIPEPGVKLTEKIQEKIREATVFLVILTEHSIRSEWVKKELAYAEQLQKPIIPLKEESVAVNSPIEWIEFSRNEKPEIVASKIISAIDNRLKKNAPQIAPNDVAVFAFAVFAAIFLGFLVFAASRD
jgi:hypothetical protein